MIDKAIRVLVVEPMKASYVKEIDGSLESMQALVGGYIQATYPFDDPVAVVLNEEGKLLSLPYNRPLMNEHGLIYDIVCGTFFVAGIQGEHFASLTDEQCKRYHRLFDQVRVLSVNADTPQKHHKKKGNQHER